MKSKQPKEPKRVDYKALERRGRIAARVAYLILVAFFMTSACLVGLALRDFLLSYYP